MDKAIKKASKTIKYHSIKTKPKLKKGNISKKDQEFLAKNEFNKWVDDSYLLMGEAYFMKAEFIPAKQNFEYIIREYNKEEIKYDAMIWIGRTNLATRNYKTTRSWIDQISADKDFPKRLDADFEILQAAYFFAQKDKDSSIPHLLKAINLNKNKKQKVRHQYLLAQLYKEKGNFRRAAKIFEEVSKSNSKYEMGFNAKINMAECYGKLGGSYKDMKKLLCKMLRDDKNIEYLDQVYYALAEIEFKNGKTNEAIKNYKLSSENSLYNTNQKAISCMKLGNIYFNEPDYRPAQAYYDTCILNLSNENSQYEYISTLSRNLTGLVENLDIVEYEDSLQRIALLPDKERNELIDNIIREVVEQEQLEKEQARETQQNSMLFDQRNGSSQISAPTGGEWYFYNPATLSFGQNEFRKKWGTRKLEDHWRRSNKAVILIDDAYAADQDSTENDSTRVTNRISDNKSRKFYMQNLPLTDSLIAISNEKISSALFDIGSIYMNDFSDWKKSIASFESLESRFPDQEFKLTTYYNLYELYTKLNNSEKATSFKNLITINFPDSYYSKFLQNPNYQQELLEQKRQERLKYEEIYTLYRSNQIEIAKAKSLKFISENPQSEYFPKVTFISIISSALEIEPIDLKRQLANFIQNYQDDPLSNRASQILAYLGETDIEALMAELASRPDPVITAQKNDSINSETIPNSKYNSISPDEPHIYVIAVSGDFKDTKQLRFEISNFNIFTFNLRTFGVSFIPLKESSELVIVKPFKNQRQSVNYMKLIHSNQNIFNTIKDIDYEQFVISSSNLKILKNEKDIEEYLEFYRANYLNQ
jgi:tetratricopeptide (TPR) repeat protein